MDANRLEAMRAVAWNLKLEGQQSRSECVTELCDEVARLNSICSHAGILRAQEQHNSMMAEKDAEIERLRLALRYVLEDEPNGLPRASSSCRAVARKALGA